MGSDEVREFLGRPSAVVAPALLGWTIASYSPDGVVAVELTEVEAYAGEADPASHAWRGRTARTAVMYGPAGHLYVYRSHGIHLCANIVTGDDGTASAVLLRAGRVVDGVELARARRGPKTADRSLARGPGCLGQALGLAITDSGAHLLDAGQLRLSLGDRAALPVASGPRVGVSRAADVPWRFWIDGDPTVSAYKRSPRAR